MSALRPALRIARRELTRRKGRTLLVVLMVAVPVAGFVVGQAVARTVAIVPGEVQVAGTYGGADALVEFQPSLDPAGPEEVDQAALAADKVTEVVPGARTVSLRQAWGSIVAPDANPISFRVSAGPIDDPLVAPQFHVYDGRLPSAPGEVALSPSVASRLGVGTGDALDLPDLGLHGRVVGLAGQADSRDAADLLTTSVPPLDPRTFDVNVLVGLPGPDKPAEIDTLFAANLQPRPSPLASHPNSTFADSPQDQQVVDKGILASLIGEALAFAVLGIVISVAFTVGARRKVRTLGLVAASGGSPGAVRAVVVSEGLVAGIVGSVTGAALALVLLAAGWPLWGGRLAPWATWWTVLPSDVVAVCAIGVLASVVASWLPARSISRLSVLQSLSGRRPLPPVGARLPIIGLVLAGIGLAALAGAVLAAGVDRHSENLVAALAIVGGLAVLAGTVVGSQLVIAGFARLGSRLGGASRLALRSLGRQRSRYGSVVSVVAVVSSVVILASLSYFPRWVWASSDGGFERSNTVELRLAHPTTGPDARAAALEAVSPAAAVIPGSSTVVYGAVPVGIDMRPPTAAASPISPYLMSQPAVVATPEVLDDLHAPDEWRTALAAHDAVGLLGRGIDGIVSRPIVHSYADGNVGPALDTAWVPGVFPTGSDERLPTSTVLISPRAVAARNLGEPGITSATVVAPRPIDDEQVLALQRLTHQSSFQLEGAAAPSPTFYLAGSAFTTGSYTNTYALVVGGVLIGSLLLSGLIIAMGVALASNDSREERDGLEALGAPPAMLARTEGIKAAALAAVGALIAIPAVGLPVAVMAGTQHLGSDQPVENWTAWLAYVPWTLLGWMVVVVPLLLGFFAMSGARLRQWRRPVAASQFSFD